MANVSDLVGKLDSMKQQLADLQNQNQDARKSAPVPHVRTGENPLSSRGYSFMKLFQVISGQLPKDQAKVEIDISNRLQKFWYDQHGYQKTEANSILAPVGADLLPAQSESDHRFVKEVKDVVKAGVAGADLDEMRQMVRKTLSWNDETALGALVAPPQFGELIDLLRNNEIFMQAGASTIGMPPNGRIVFPRQTGASSAYYIGENTAITASEPTTGDVIMQAKKVACLVKIPNELFRYASVSVEAFVRNDVTKTLSLKMDKELLEGTGSGISPKGLINYAGITKHTASGTPADGNSGYPLLPEDIYQMIAKVEEKNAVFKSWVMRPLLWAYIANRRTDAVSAGDGKGPFLFNVWRELADNLNVDRNSVATLAGYPVYKSTQLSNTRTRGSGSTFTYMLGGDFSDYVVAMSPTIEFAMTQQGDTAFQNDQTWLRAILAHDGAPRHEASFVLCDQLLS